MLEDPDMARRLQQVELELKEGQLQKNKAINDLIINELGPGNVNTNALPSLNNSLPLPAPSAPAATSGEVITSQGRTFLRNADGTLTEIK